MIHGTCLVSLETVFCSINNVPINFEISLLIGAWVAGLVSPEWSFPSAWDPTTEPVVEAQICSGEWVTQVL
jgi:hypothetical protein